MSVTMMDNANFINEDEQQELAEQGERIAAAEQK
jgi:hypothetical protein